MRFKVSCYGWLPDLPNHRDRLCAALAKVACAVIERWRFVACNPRGTGWSMKVDFVSPHAGVTVTTLASNLRTAHIVQQKPKPQPKEKP